MKPFLILTSFSLLFACQKKQLPEVTTGSNKIVAAAGAPSDPARAALKSLIENVTSATGKRFDAKDNVGHNMDCAKIIANPEAGGYIAVYHTYVNGEAKVNLASSTDLLNWTWIRELAGSITGAASQPTIKVASDGGFVMAWEQEPSNHLKFVYFRNWNDLKNGVVNKRYDAARLFSSCAEGTPNLYSASSTRLDVGFHYYKNCDVDRQARGTLTNFNSWTASTQGNFDNALLHWGVAGNIGDRDGHLNFQGYNFGLIEGQFKKGDFGSWRSFIYDYSTGNAEQLNIRTNGGSTAFANPTITALTINGQNAMVVTLFVPSEGAAPGEAGELIYYKTY
jgi:hypothetical protein